jgi:hypothetical protein
MARASGPKRAFIVPFLLLLVASAGPARAQHRFILRAQAGYAFPEENKHRGGAETGFGVVVPVAGRTSLVLEVMRWSVRSLGSPGKLYAGSLEISPVAAALRFELLRNQFFFPYAFAGAAVVFTRFEIGPYLSIPELKIDQKIENGVALFFGLGARLAITPALSFVSEAAYLPRTAPAQTIITDMNLGAKTEDIVANLRTVLFRFALELGF